MSFSLHGVEGFLGEISNIISDTEDNSDPFAANLSAFLTFSVLFARCIFVVVMAVFLCKYFFCISFMFLSFHLHLVICVFGAMLMEGPVGRRFMHVKDPTTAKKMLLCKNMSGHREFLNLLSRVITLVCSKRSF